VPALPTVHLSNTGNATFRAEIDYLVLLSAVT